VTTKTGEVEEAVRLKVPTKVWFPVTERSPVMVKSPIRVAAPVFSTENLEVPSD